jgi:serine/threonine-protein kinase
MATLPSEIGRYQIKSRVGRGGMGDLYLAFDPNTSRLVALKLLNATLDSAEMRERFAREARALAALNHPNIVNIYDTGEYDDSPFIVMEYIRGETLAEMIKRRAPLSIPRKLKLMAELCAGLAQAHEAGIVHRDIKPANLMVDQQGRLKILDFGIARVAEENRTRLGLALTQVNMMIGTPGYMAPEQIEGRPFDHRVDIFAVGAVCYELLSYGEAFSGTTRQMARGVLTGRPALLSSVVPGLDPEVDEIVFRALKRDPDKRYPDAATLQKALERVSARIGAGAIEDASDESTPPPVPYGGKREVRAEAAYQRALMAQCVNAPESARRYALEALAEDPTHAGVQTLLALLERRPAPPVVTQAATPLAAPTVANTSADPSPSGTVVNTSANLPPSGMVVNPSADRSPAGTVANRTAVRTVVGPPTSASRGDSSPTVIIPASTKPAGRKPAAPATPAAKARSAAPSSKGQPFRDAFDRLRRSDAGLGKRAESPWIRYRWPALAVLLALVAGTVFMVATRKGATGQLLTITRPVGGTLTGPGITCGTRGADCTVSRPTGDPIELTPEADADYAFSGYTGDCAPGGRTIMSRPRTCGATFTKVEPTAAAPAAATQVITITPVPTGGTIEGVDIICGTKGTACSAKYPDGLTADFHETPDPEYTFMGFVGDCAPLGHTQMIGPRTCSATFSLTSEVSKPAPIKPSPPVRNAGAAPAGLPAPSPQSPPDVTAPVQSGRRGNPPAPAVAVGDKPAPPPQTPEEFAKGKIQETLTSYCAAQQAMDPDGVQRVYPSVNMKGLKMELNRSKYRSITCKFSDIVFTSIDPEAGKATVQASVKHVYEHTSLTEKPTPDERDATIKLMRPGPRAQWQIEEAKYTPKAPK